MAVATREMVAFVNQEGLVVEMSFGVRWVRAVEADPFRYELQGKGGQGAHPSVVLGQLTFLFRAVGQVTFYSEASGQVTFCSETSGQVTFYFRSVGAIQCSIQNKGKGQCS